MIMVLLMNYTYQDVWGAQKWLWFCLWIYLPGPWIRYIIRTMSAKHALLVRNQTLFITGFHAPPAHKMALSHSKHILWSSCSGSLPISWQLNTTHKFIALCVHNVSTGGEPPTSTHALRYIWQQPGCASTVGDCIGLPALVSGLVDFLSINNH